MSSKNIAVIGSGMTSTYLLKHMIDHAESGCTINIIEKGPTFGPGMPYSEAWVNKEHLANSGSQEIPDLLQPMHEWLKVQSDEWLREYNIERDKITPTAIYPRIVLGHYFADQFKSLVVRARQKGINVVLRSNTTINDIADCKDQDQVKLTITKDSHTTEETFDKAVIATGHSWPDRIKTEELLPSPWPASKLTRKVNHPVGILGSSLSAVDTALTLADQHGTFSRDPAGKLHYTGLAHTENFKIVMHSRQGLLPDLRCHYQYPEHDVERYSSKIELERLRAQNNGFLPLNYMFDTVYKRAIKKVDQKFYDRIKDWTLEDFIRNITDERKNKDVFEWFKKEYAISEDSLKFKKPQYWKEILDDVAYTISFNGQHLSAEDMIRFKRGLMPMVAYVVAFQPLESAEKMIALNEVGKLEVHATGKDLSIASNPDTPGATLRYQKGQGTHDEHFKTFINSTGQQDTSISQFPFKTLVTQKIAQPALLKFSSPEAAIKEKASLRAGEPDLVDLTGPVATLKPGGVMLDESFRLVGEEGPNPRIFDLAIPHIIGLYPYTQSLPFCSHSAERVASAILEKPGHQSGTWEQQTHRAAGGVSRF